MSARAMLSSWRTAAALAAVIAAGMVVAMLPVARVRAMSMRQPTADERKILTRYASAVDSVLRKFTDANWIEDDGNKFDIDDVVMVSSDPKVPLDVDEMIQRDFRISPQSELYRRQIAPVMAKMEAATDMKEKMRLLESMPTGRVEVEVHFNRSEATVDPEMKGGAVTIPGAAMAWQRADPEKKKEASAMLLFGDWKSASSIADGYRFHFARKGNYAAIENIVVEMHGSATRVDELMHVVPWKLINGGLTTAVDR